MRVAYFDCFAGISGDMIVGAQLDMGLDVESLKTHLSSLGLKGYELVSRPVERGGVAATKFDVEIDQTAQPARNFEDIRSMIAAANLSDQIKTRSIQTFERLAVAEAKVHATTPDKVHFHEVGAVDSIIDTVGAMIGFELLGVEAFFCSPLRVGSGLIDTQHGRLPIPAPATAELLRGAPVYAGDIEGEFVTPTGAAIVATLCQTFGPMAQMKVARVGYGAGTRNPKRFPNALRLVVGEIEDTTDKREETINIVETNIDDMSPQVYGFVMERAFALGAIDVFMVAAQMKKDRPGTLLTVLCGPETLSPIIDMLLAETTTLGVRCYEAKRRVLERDIENVETGYGSIRVKVARQAGRTLHFQPEYEDCARAATAAKVPLLEVQAAAVTAYRNKMKNKD
jgi:pyridinium-3,5-bisthiocarboxylic acid mononucleotide nickel chelatase